MVTTIKPKVFVDLNVLTSDNQQIILIYGQRIVCVSKYNTVLQT